MKFVIHRTRVGWGDRICGLLSAVDYAIATKRILVVDWRDITWSGDHPEKNFEYYFSLNKIVPYITYTRFLEIIKKININGVFPFKWENWETVIPYCKDDILAFFYAIKYTCTGSYKHDRLQEFDDNQKYLFNKFNETYDKFINDLDDIINLKVQDVEHDVVLYLHEGCDLRKLILYGKLIFNENVLNFIKHDRNYFTISSNISYDCVHLRGTDRSNLGIYYNNSINLEKYINNIAGKIDEDCKNLMILTDSKTLKDKFTELYSHKYNFIYSSTILDEDNNPLHLILDNKEQSNLHTIKDFNYLINSHRIYSDNISYFSTVPKIIKKYLGLLKTKDTEAQIKIINEIVDTYSLNIGILDQIK